MTGLADAGERGRLDIDGTVLRKIVEYAADGTPGTLRHERRVAGLGMGSSGASARVTDGPDGAVDVRLELTLQYPAPVRRTVDAVRSRVGGELSRITGRRIRHLAVTVTGLRGADDGAGASGARVE
ncbi:Asp23/Gls24 family envelope stress response protein [Pseudonocardia sp.]|uniref:Asp23/Gls24 family envelope stress response protein n=1 Tax=Pseudonocardia sp. TaxID=60912 RepID=UPI00262D6E50|nr:Asp23/Gls24 family envelope stress response protein [Pseudonocardia sp.]